MLGSRDHTMSRVPPSWAGSSPVNLPRWPQTTGAFPWRHTMTRKEIERVRRELRFWKDVGHSSKMPVHVNRLEILLDLADAAAAFSSVERSAARRHMERARRSGSFAA